MILDTGAAVSIIIEATYWTLWLAEGPSVQPSTTALNTYTGEPIHVKGSMTLHVQHNDQSVELPVVLVEGAGPPLLARDWLHRFQLDCQG